MSHKPSDAAFATKLSPCRGTTQALPSLSGRERIDGIESGVEGFCGGEARTRGGRARAVVESFPNRGSGVKRLGDVSHVREGVLQFSQLSIEPALATAVPSQVRF